MSRFVQDHVLLSYEVHSVERTILLHTTGKGEPPALTQVKFTGVEAYHFNYDAPMNLLYGVEAVPVERLIQDHRAELGKARKTTGWSWAKKLAVAPVILRSKGIQGFYVEATVGLSGWVLAQSVAVLPEPQPTDVPGP